MESGGWTGLNENNAMSALTKIEVKVEAELGTKYSFLVATNIVDSRPPKHRPTGTLERWSLVPIIMVEIVATDNVASRLLKATNCNTNSSCQKKKKITLEIVATNIVASRPPNGDRLQHQLLVPKVHIRLPFIPPG